MNDFNKSTVSSSDVIVFSLKPDLTSGTRKLENAFELKTILTTSHFIRSVTGITELEVVFDSIGTVEMVLLVVVVTTKWVTGVVLVPISIGMLGSVETFTGRVDETQTAWHPPQ